MTPLTTNPTAVVLTDNDGKVLATATNVAPDLNLIVTRDLAVFKAEAANKPFDTTRPVAPESAFTSKKK